MAVDVQDARGTASPQRPSQPRVSVVMPAINEAANLPHVFARLPDDLFEVILVDGGSIDDTVMVAHALCPEVRVIVERRPGKGIALAAGFAASRGEIIIMLDADGSTDPAEIPAFVAALLAGADFAKGSRFARGGNSEDLTIVRRMGNRVLSSTVNALFGTHYTDLCYGYNAFWSRHLTSLCPDCHGFEVETLLDIRAAQAGLRVVEVPSYEYRRIHGVSKLRPWRDGRRVLRTILRERMRPRQPSLAGEELAADGVVSAT